MNNTISLILVVLCWCLQVGCSNKTEDEVVHRPGEPDYVRLGTETEQLMDKAIAEAKSTLSTFEEALAAGGTNRTEFAVKKGFAYGTDSGREYIWIIDVVSTNGGFGGILNNEPVDATDLTLGQKVFVKKEEVSDWMYMENGTLQGGYTIAALTYGTDEQDDYEKGMGIDWKQYHFLNP